MLHVDLIPDDRALPASNTLYGMVQVTLKGTDGRSVSKVINVRQLNRDMEFHAYPDNSYPAVGGDDLEFTVASEGKWRLLPNVADAYLTLKDPIEETTGHHPPVTSFTYPFKLTSNVNSYAPRTATVEVNLDNLAFSPAISFDIVQAGTPPYLVITDPAAAGAPPAHEYDFGDKNLPKTITFKTNAGWTFSTDGNFDKVISEVTYGGFPIYAGLPAQTGSTIPTMEVEENVIFTPIASALAGETVTNVIFTTVNQEGAPETPPSVVSLSRLVPANWEFLYAKEGNTLLKDGDNISPAATIVTLAANTNLQWWGKQGTAEPEYSNPSAYTMDDKIDMTISKRPTDQTSSWNTPENITITVGYDAQTGIPALSPVHQFTLKRPIYELYVSNINPTTVPCYAGTVNVTFNSNADDYYVQWRNSSNENTSAVIGTAQILVSGVGTQTVPYPATGAFQDRSLYLYNALTGKLLYDTEVSQRMPRYTTGTVQGTRGGSSTTNCPTGYSRSYTGGV
jgi:hypothetical protein